MCVPPRFHPHTSHFPFTAPNPHEQALLNRIGTLQRDVWTVCVSSPVQGFHQLISLISPRQAFVNKSRISLVQTGMPGETVDQLIDRSSEGSSSPSLPLPNLLSESPARIRSCQPWPTPPMGTKSILLGSQTPRRRYAGARRQN